MAFRCGQKYQSNLFNRKSNIFLIEVENLKVFQSRSNICLIEVENVTVEVEKLIIEVERKCKNHIREDAEVRTF